MRTTVTLDDDLIEAARAISGVQDRSALLHAGLRALIERETARRLARLGGSEPTSIAPPRRRSRAVASPSVRRPRSRVR